MGVGSCIRDTSQLTGRASSLNIHNTTSSATAEVT